MSLLNILCSICTNYFKNNDVIYSTRCGHVFHKSCLFKWIKKAYTCPQCRRHCLEHLCHQLFVNFDEVPLDDTDMDIEYPKTYEWICADGDIDYTNDMSFAFMLGWDEDGSDVYLARCRFKGNIIPGFYVATKGEIVVSWESEPHCLKEEIEILDISNDSMAQYKWIPAANGNIPENAFATGSTTNGNILYATRAEHKGKLLYGKLEQGSIQAHLPYENEEVTNSNYEVLVRVSSELNTTALVKQTSPECVLKE